MSYEKTLARLLLNNYFQIVLGNNARSVGYLTYKSGDVMDTSCVKWGLIGGCTALIVVAAIVAGSWFLIRSHKNKSNKKDSSGESSYGRNGDEASAPPADFQPGFVRRAGSSLFNTPLPMDHNKDCKETVYDNV